MPREPLIYVIAPNAQQAAYWLQVARIPRERARYAGAMMEQLRGVKPGTTVYRVGAPLEGAQFRAFHDWVRPRFNVVVGLPDLDPEIVAEARRRDWDVEKLRRSGA